MRHDKLRQIEQDCSRETEWYKTEMLNCWLQGDPEASWSKVVEALWQMDHVVLAQQLQGKYIHQPSRGETGLIPCISITIPQVKGHKKVMMVRQVIGASQSKPHVQI